MSAINFSGKEDFTQLTKAAHYLSNVVSGPSNYFMGGKTVKCTLVPVDYVYRPSSNGYSLYRHIVTKPVYDFFFAEEEASTVVKTTAYAVLAIPSYVAGSALKGLALCSENVRGRYYQLQKDNNKELYAKIADGIAIALCEKKTAKIFTLLQLAQSSNAEGSVDFYDYFALKGNFVFLRGFSQLFPAACERTQANTDRQNISDKIVACYLKFFAEGKVLHTQFYEQLRVLGEVYHDERNSFDAIINAHEPVQVNAARLEAMLRKEELIFDTTEVDISEFVDVSEELAESGTNDRP